ncbi:MAG: hypothetical protein IPM24_09635 [Bryobacterales bacterium]|nr:hypothetical protein [Bryobacterales bacterium]
MDQVKKATILFPPDLYDQLAVLARARSSSVGELVRDACRRQYFLTTRDERRAAVAGIAALSLPVGTPEEMELESVPRAESLP